MTFQVIHPPHPTPVQSPYRIVQHETKREVVWANRFLDRECIRCLAETTLRSYALDLLHFLRWWVSVYRTDIVTEEALTESTLLEYVRFQAGQSPRPAAAAINRRVVVADHALKSEFPNAPGQFAPGFHQLSWKRSAVSVARPRQALSRLRVKAPKRVILPLSVDEVARFWSSFRTSRDLAIVGLMLLHGLRSQEVLSLNKDDLLLAESQIRVRGKGRKIRFLPLAPETVELLDHYLRLERPSITDTAVFVSLKGRARHAHETRGLAVTLPSSPHHHRCHPCQPTSVPPHVRLRHDPSRCEFARAHATHGSLADSDHPGLCPTDPA
jgi:integrase